MKLAVLAGATGVLASLLAQIAVILLMPGGFDVLGGLVSPSESFGVKIGGFAWIATITGSPMLGCGVALANRALVQRLEA